ncbi:MAG TPA: WGR domain-containing protein [Acidimicrobiales bacterium]|nr:WGR domain-containing protein [Acidimicrobiales bacterium]
MTTTSIELVFIDGKSAKFWNAHTNGAELHTAWGRIGTTGQSKVATLASPEAATAAFEKAAREKLAKGYVEQNTDPAAGTPQRAVSVPVLRPMLAQEIATGDSLAYLTSDDFFAQQKLDGHRLMLHCADGEVTVLGRSGQSSQHAPRFAMEPYATELARLGNVTLDGELIDDLLYVFDAPRIEAAGIDTATPYAARRAALDDLFAAWQPNPAAFRVVPTAQTTEAKLELLAQCDRIGAEGIMLKHVAAPYQPGQRVDTMLKVKFVRDADFVVSAVGVGGHDNYELGLYNEQGELEVVGRCSGIGKEQCAVGDVVTVRYLYVATNGKLYQPRMMRRRTDKPAQSCVLAQIANHGVNKVVL